MTRYIKEAAAAVVADAASANDDNNIRWTDG